MIRALGASFFSNICSLTLVPHTGLLKLRFSCRIGGFFFLNEATLVGLLDEARYLKDQAMIKSLESAACPPSLEREERLRVVLMIHHHTYLMKLLGRCWERGAPGEGMEFLCPFPHTFFFFLTHLLHLDVHPYPLIINW